MHAVSPAIAAAAPVSEPGFAFMHWGTPSAVPCELHMHDLHDPFRVCLFKH